MKKGLSRADIKTLFKLRNAGYSEQQIARHMHTSVDVIGRFTPEIMAAADEVAKERERIAMKAEAWPTTDEEPLDVEEPIATTDEEPDEDDDDGEYKELDGELTFNSSEDNEERHTDDHGDKK